MFSALHTKSKLIIIISFILICLISGFLIFFGLNSFFSKKFLSTNSLKNTISKEKVQETTKKDDTEIIEKQEKPKKQENSKNLKNKVSDNKNDMDVYITNMYTVGEDINPGVYKIVSTSNKTAQFTISDTKDKSKVDFYQGHLFFNFRYVELKENQTLYLIDADILQDNQNTRYSDSRYVSGQYKVGFDIAAGTYRLVPTSQAGYVEISSSALGDTIFSRYIETSVDISIKQGQYLSISGINILK